jgi:acyl-CoA synthetase (AMP-forming)/AMP-acid ligase II
MKLANAALKKAVMISHYNVISNILQIEAYERPQRGAKPQSRLGMLPQSHIYGLVVICHATIYVGDSVITLPKYKFDWMLSAAERFQIEIMYLVSSLSTSFPALVRLMCISGPTSDYHDGQE